MPYCVGMGCTQNHVDEATQQRRRSEYIGLSLDFARLFLVRHEEKAASSSGTLPQDESVGDWV